MGGIVVGVDGGESSLRALERAILLAIALEQSVHVVIAMRRRESPAARELALDLDAAWRRAADRQLRQASMLATTILVGQRHPARLICDEASQREAVLIVVGGRRTRGAPLVMRSVAADVLRLAPCDVLVATPTTSTPATRPYAGRPVWL